MKDPRPNFGRSGGQWTVARSPRVVLASTVLLAVLSVVGSLPAVAAAAPAAAPSGSSLGPVSLPLPSGPADYNFGPPFWLGGHVGPVPGALTPPGVPKPARVNPYGIYSSEPAPVGVADFGINSTGYAYTYSTTAFRGTVHFGSWTANAQNLSSGNGNYTSLQLNVVVVLSHGSTLADYWIQDVPIYNTSSHVIYFEDNVWNLSGKSTLTANSVQGNGSIYSHVYYADGVYGTYPGAGVTLTLPTNVSTEVTASDISGTTHVGFLYNDGYGWVIYDNVTFPYTKGWTFHGFQVNGSSYNPSGLFNDAEWILGGPGGGSGINDVASNFTMDLQYWNGHNFAAVPNAYDFGSDTAEHIGNIVPKVASTSPPHGTPGGRYTAGSGSLGFDYGVGSTAILNATMPAVNGTLLDNGTAVAYVGTNANLTLMPGTYVLGVRSGTTLVASANVTLSAGEYDPLNFGTFSLTPSEAFAGASVTAGGKGFLAGSSIEITWPGQASPVCSTTVASNTSFGCSFDVPLVGNGSYDVTAVDSGGVNDRAYSAFLVETNLSLSLAASKRSTDAGGKVELWANASAGYTPYANYTWYLGSGSPTVTSVGTLTRLFPLAGNYTINVTVRDRLGDLATASLKLVVEPDPLLATPTANRSSADVGQAVAFSVIASDGSGGFTYNWSGLPTGCVPAGALATCGAIGPVRNYSIYVSASDSNGFTAFSAALAFEVFVDPTVVGLRSVAPAVDAGELFTLAATTSGGAGQETFTWTGLPSGCASTSSTATCTAPPATTLHPAVAVTDGNGVTSAPLAADLTIEPDPSVTLVAVNATSADVGQTATFSATVTGGAGGLSYAWTGLPAGCPSRNASSVSCVEPEPGPTVVAVAITDLSGARANASLSFQVWDGVQVAWSVRSLGPIDVAQSLAVAVTADGGNGSYTYAWTGLPAGCAAPAGPSLSCLPSAAGDFSLVVLVTDANQGQATSTALTLLVNPRPALTGLTATPSSVLSGARLTLSASPGGGTGPLAFSWSGLPAGCASTDAANLTCTPSTPGTYSVQLTETDSRGVSATTTRTVTVAPSFLGFPEAEGLALVIVPIALVAVGIGYVLRRRSKEPPAPPDEEVFPEAPTADEPPFEGAPPDEPGSPL